nr:hypothetical protein [Tanacetum cinerariifolium]
MWWRWCVDWWRDEVVAGGLGAAVEVDSGGVVGRVGESGVGDLIDRKTRIIFGFAGNARRKSFPAVVAGGWWWLAGDGGLAGGDGDDAYGCKYSTKLAVLGCIQPIGSTRMYRDLSLRTSGPK